MAAQLTADTTVVVSALSDWHEAHDACRRRLEHVDWFPAHVLAESVSVLSRLPRGFAVPLDAAVEAVRGLCANARQLRADRYLPVLASLGRAGLGGAAVYDAIICATALDHGATLLSLDRRAQRTYAALGARYELLDEAR